MPTYTDLAQLVKQKYPQYQNVDDNTLAQKIIEKYPQYGQTFQPEQQGGVGGIVKSLLQPAKRYGEMVGEAVGQLGRRALNNGEYTFLSGQLDKGIATEEQSKRFEQLNAPILMKQQDLAKYQNFGSGALETAKRTAGGASYLVPGGQGIKGLALAGGAAAALSEFSRPDSTFESVAGSALTGTVLGAGMGVAGKVLSKANTAVTNKLSNVSGKVKNIASKEAEQAINKATPTMYSNAVTEHGIDINALTNKYVLPNTGYDDMLGKIAERGKGGYLGENLNVAESQIQQGIKSAGSSIRIDTSDFVTQLKAQLRDLKKIGGNESNIQALEKLIKSTEKVYGNGRTAKQLLDVKRIADNKFGAAVVDETTGSVNAQYQKMLANYARSKLKENFPDIAQALDVQSEIYTLRPILNRARSIQATQGSSIRTGNLAAVNPLNPLTYGKAVDYALSDPKRASKLLNKGGEVAKVSDGSKLAPVRAALNTPTGIVGRNAFIGNIAAGTTPQMTNQMNPNIESGVNNEYGNQQLQHNPSIAQTSSTGYTPEQIARAIQIDLANGGKAYTRLKQLYDLTIEEQKRTQPKASTSGKAAAKDVKTAASGLRDLDALEKMMMSNSKLFGAALPGALGSRDWVDVAHNVKDSIARLRTGAAITKTEEHLYDQFIPQLLDPPQVRQQKVNRLRQYFSDFANAEGVVGLDTSQLGQ